MLELHDATNEGALLLVKGAEIIDVGANTTGPLECTVVVLSNGDRLLVTETVEEVRDLLKG